MPAHAGRALQRFRRISLGAHRAETDNPLKPAGKRKWRHARASEAELRRKIRRLGFGVDDVLTDLFEAKQAAFQLPEVKKAIELLLNADPATQLSPEKLAEIHRAWRQRRARVGS